MKLMNRDEILDFDDFECQENLLELVNFYDNVLIMCATPEDYCIAKMKNGKKLYVTPRLADGYWAWYKEKTNYGCS